MSAEQHIGCASNSDQHHPGDADGLVMHAALEPDAAAYEPCRYEPYKNIEDLRRHRPPPDQPLKMPLGRLAGLDIQGVRIGGLGAHAEPYGIPGGRLPQLTSARGQAPRV